MKRLLLVAILFNQSCDFFSQKDLTYTLMDQFDLGYNLLFLDDTNLLFEKSDGGFTTVSNNLPKTGIGDESIRVRTFNVNGHESGSKFYDLGDEPFNGAYYIGTILNDGAVMVLTSPTRTHEGGYGGNWTFWKLSGLNFTKHKELQLEDGGHRICTKVHQSENKRFTLLEILHGEGFVLLNNDLEIEGDYEFLDKDNDDTKNFIKLDNVIVDNSGNIGLSILAVGMVKQWILGVERGQALWMLGVINNASKKLESFDVSSVIKQETYTESFSKFVDLNENEFLLLNKGKDMLRISKKDGSLVGHGQIEVDKYCIVDNETGLYHKGLDPLQLERIDDKTVCILLRSSGQVAFQLLVVNVNGTVINSEFLSPPMKLTTVDYQVTYKNEPFIFVENNGIRAFTRLSESEAEAVKSQNFESKKIKYGKDRLVYKAEYDLTGKRKSFGLLTEAADIKCQQVAIRTSGDNKYLQLDFGDGGKMQYLIAKLK